MEALRAWAFQMQADGVLPGIFEYGFLINALVAALIIGPLLGGMGSLVVINNDGLYSLLSKEVAEQVKARDPKRIITGQEEEKKPEPGSDDEYYAQFEVPDDLDW